MSDAVHGPAVIAASWIIRDADLTVERFLDLLDHVIRPQYKLRRAVGS